MNQNNKPPGLYKPEVPIYPQVLQLLRVIAPALSGSPTNVYPARTQQVTAAGSTRDRETCYVWHPGGSLGAGFILGRLVGSHLGAPLYVATCCPSGQFGSSSSAPETPSGLVMSWGFNEGTGNTVTDSQSGYNLSAPLIVWSDGTIGPESGYGGSINLSSTTTAITYNGTTATPSGSSAISIAFWFLITTADSSITINLASNASNGHKAVFTASGSNTLIFSNGVIVINSSTTPTLNVWNFVVLEIDDFGNWYYFVDGVQVDSGNIGQPLDTVANGVSISGSSTTGVALLKNLQVYNTLMSAEDVENLYNGGLLAEWLLNAGSGDVAADTLSGYNLNGSGVDWSSQTPGSQAGAGGSLDLSGSLSTLTRSGLTPLPSGADPVTVTFWFFFSATDGTVFIDYGQNASAGDNAEFSRSGDNSIVFTDGIDTATSTGAPTTNTWHFYALTINASGGYSYYEDGLLKKTSTLGHQLSTVTNGIAMGGSSASGTTLLKDVLIFDHVLTAQEIFKMSRRDPVAEWLLNNASGNVATELFNGYALTGSSVNWSVSTPGSQAGSGGSLNLSGATSSLTLNKMTLLPTGKAPLTVTFWYYLSSADGSVFFKFAANAATGHNATFGRDGTNAVVFTNGTQNISTVSVPTLNAWRLYSLAINADGSWSYYENGALAASGIANALETVPNGLAITGGSLLGTVLLKDVRVYNFALSLAEVVSLYSSGTYPSSSSSTPSSDPNTFTTPGDFVWTSPVTTTITITVWGAGGLGGDGNASFPAGGGGGGGYIQVTTAVTVGDVFNVHIASGTASGEQTTVISLDTLKEIRANQGGDGAIPTGGGGGTLSTTETTVLSFNGGDGGNMDNSGIDNGAGGGAASSALGIGASGDFNSAGGAGGVGVGGGGSGGNGTTGNGDPGQSPGGGGGGGGKATTTGGSGGAGKVAITW